MKKKRNLYIIAFLCFITLVGVTIAYLQSTDTFQNIFNAGTYSVVTHEEFTSPTNWKPGDTTPKTITTTNEGTIPVRVRVKFEESWKDSNDNDLSLTNNDENVAIINFDNSEDWISRDGYYYYVNELAPGESTSSLIQSVTFNPNYEGIVTCTFNSTTNSNECSSSDGYMGGTYKLSITTETVQADDYQNIWSHAPIMYDYVGDNPCTFEGELVPGAEYVNGQYTYRYRREYVFTGNIHWGEDNIDDFGWGVRLTDENSTSPVTSTLCSSINNKPIVSMAATFGRSQATSIDLSSFDTSNVTNMHGMFWATKAESINVSNFDTSKVTNMSTMFGTSNALSLDLRALDTSNVTDMTAMFSNSQASSLDLSDFDTSNVTDMSMMFYNSKATTLDLSSFDTSNVTNMKSMFRSAKAQSINLSSFDTSNVTDMAAMFISSSVTSLDLSNFDTSKVTDMSHMFQLSAATTINLSSFDTSNVTDMSYMFCVSVATSLNLSNFDTSKVTDMSRMFSGSQVTSLNVSSFDTSNVTNMINMFHGSQLTTLDLSNFDTSKVTDMSDIFENAITTTGYARTQADADKFNTSSNKPSGLTFVVKSS